MLKKPHQPIQIVNIDHLNLMESQLLGGYLQKSPGSNIQKDFSMNKNHSQMNIDQKDDYGPNQKSQPYISSYNYQKDTENRQKRDFSLREEKIKQFGQESFVINNQDSKITQFPMDSQLNQKILCDPLFYKNMGNFYATNEPPLITKSNQVTPQKNPDYSKTLPTKSNIFDQPSNLRRQIFQNQQNVLIETSPLKNVNIFQPIDDSPQNQTQRLNPRRMQNLDQDNNFLQNANNFYAMDQPSVPQPQEKKPYYMNITLNEPRFQENQNQFYAIHEPPLNDNKERQKALILKDAKFLNNLHNFYAINDQITHKKNASELQKSDSTYKRTSQIMQNSKLEQTKVLSISDSSSTVRNSISLFFNARGVEEFDEFTCPGGPLAFTNNNKILIESLKDYLQIMCSSYQVKELVIFSSINQLGNSKVFLSQINDKNSHQLALQNLKEILENQLKVTFRVNGVFFDPRGVGEKLF